MSKVKKTTDKDKKNWFVRHKVLTGIGAFVLLLIIASAGSSPNKTTTTITTSSNSSKTATKAVTMPKLNEVARDGKFEFTVTKFDCGEATVGTNQYLTKTAQGQYCRLGLTIKNIGDKAQSLSSGDQKLIDAQNKQYSADDQATFYAAPEGSSSTWYNDINPGNSVSGDIIFDIPKTVTPIVAQLHDSAFSSGVKVSLQ